MSAAESQTLARLAFRITARDGAARVASLATPHGVVETPAFMPVATFGAVRGIGAWELAEAGAQILLTNTYHLHERPGEALIRAQGGIHEFAGWRGPWLSDSGGFQVTSLGDRAQVDESGVRFASPVDGRRRELTPERAIEIQEALQVDIAMVLDECRPLAEGGASAAREAMERTLRWAQRSRAARRRPETAVFGIVQGGADDALRRDSARATLAIGFDGYAHGGLGLGEVAAQREALVAAVNEELPESSPRYLMGIGRPEDITDAIGRGIDLFDCVLPTRNGRHGLLFTSEGLLRLRNQRYRDDPRPVDPACDCPGCRHYSRAYLRHLHQIDEMLGARLGALHNLRFYLRLMQDARAAIRDARFAAFRAQVHELASRSPS
jgi:queuine tRNA-ribosyltransferase